MGELLKQQRWSDYEYEVFHYRDRNGLEVDVIIEVADGRVIAVEIKSSSTFKSDHFASLATLREKLGDRFVAGVVLSTATQGYQYARKLWGLPISSLWEWQG